MVATIRNLTSSSATSEYFQKDGGYYLRKGDDETDLGAKQEEHRNGSAWYGLGSSVHEVPYEELGEKAAQTWLELDPEVRDRTLLLAPTHALRAEINETVREALAAEGVLRGKALRIERLVSLGMTRAEKADVRNYHDGDTVVFHQDLVNYRVKKDEVLTVAGIEHDQVNLLHPDGKPRGIRPAGSIRYRLDVYETRPIEIRAGDRIRWTRNDKARTLINGELAEVTAIDRGRVRLRLEDGRTLSLREDDSQLRHIDHAWSSTVHGAHGRREHQHRGRKPHKRDRPRSEPSRQSPPSSFPLRPRRDAGERELRGRC